MVRRDMGAMFWSNRWNPLTAADLRYLGQHLTIHETDDEIWVEWLLQAPVENFIYHTPYSNNEIWDRFRVFIASCVFSSKKFTIRKMRYFGSNWEILWPKDRGNANTS